MFNKIALLCLLFICRSASGQKLLVYKDACEDNRFGWPVLKTGSVTDSVFYYIENGGFVVDNKRHKGAGFNWVIRSYGANPTAQTSIRVDIAQLAGDDNRPYGLVFNAKDVNTYVYFIITSNGNYGMAAIKDGKINGTPFAWTSSSLIKTGLNATNQLKVDQKGDSYSFYINEVLVKKIDFPGQPFAGNIGQFLLGSVRSKIDNIEIFQWLPESDLPCKIGPGYVSPLTMPVATKPIPSKDGKTATFSINTGVKTTSIFGTPADKYLYGLKDKDGYRLLDPTFSRIFIHPEDGFIYTELKDKDSEGILTPLLEPIVPNILQNDLFHWFTKEGYLSCKLPNGFWGVIDKAGKTILPFIYDELDDVSDGVIFARKGKLWGVIDIQGNNVIPFGSVSNNVLFKRLFRNGIAIVSASKADGGNVGLINKKGEWVVLPKYGLIRFVEQNKTYITESAYPDNNKKSIYTILDEAGKPLPIQSYNYIAESGQNYIVGEGVCYESSGSLGAAERSLCKFGLIDKSGKIIIPLKFNRILPFSNKDVFRVELHENVAGTSTVKIKIGMYNSKGKEVIPVQYEGIPNDNARKQWFFDNQRFATTEVSEDGILNVYKDGKYGAVDITGRVLIPLQFDFISSFLNGIAFAKKGTDTFFIDKSGKKVKSPEAAAPVKSEYDPVTELPPIRKS